MRIEPAEVLTWSGTEVQFGLIYGLILGLVVGLILGLVGWLGIGLVGWLSIGLVGGLGIGLLVVLSAGVSTEQLTERLNLSPNEGIWRSAKNGLVVGLVVGLGFGVVGWLVGWLIGAPFFVPIIVPDSTICPQSFDPATGVLSAVCTSTILLTSAQISGLDSGVFFGLFFGLNYGGRAFIQHFTLRFVLWRDDAMPWRYMRFLDYAAERILLRKVGGGYIFVHRLLQDYFASLDTTASASKQKVLK